MFIYTENRKHHIFDKSGRKSWSESRFDKSNFWPHIQVALVFTCDIYHEKIESLGAETQFVWCSGKLNLWLERLLYFFPLQLKLSLFLAVMLQSLSQMTVTNLIIT